VSGNDAGSDYRRSAMRRLAGILIALVLVAAVLVGVSTTAEAKSYYFPKVTIDVTVLPDGGFEFREARSYAFDDDFTWAFYQVEKVKTAGGNPVDITDFVIGESGRPFTLGDARSLNDSKEPGFYWVSYNYEGNFVYGKWFYRADDETRTFEISYVVHDAVAVYDDYAELYWKFIGENWDVPAREVTGTIHLPPGADKDRVRAWLHTELTSEYWIEDDVVRFRVERLRPGKFVEMRILCVSPPRNTWRSTRSGRGSRRSWPSHSVWRRCSCGRFSSFASAGSTRSGSTATTSGSCLPSGSRRWSAT
jgi:hypothetical protein